MPLRTFAATLACSLLLAATGAGAEPAGETSPEAPRAAVAPAPETTQAMGPERHVTAQETAQQPADSEEPDTLTVIGTGAATLLLALLMLAILL